MGQVETFPSFTERTRQAVGSTVGPLPLFTSAAGSAIQHWRDIPPEWGQGWGAYGVRFGHHMAGSALTHAIELGAGAALGEDLRYRPSGERRVWQRVRYLVARTFFVPKRDGGLGFAYSRLAGDYATAFIANAWYPPSSNKVHDALLRGTWSMAWDFGHSAFGEFWPDLKKLLRRHRP